MATPISEEELQLKKRARRRLIGAIALVTVVAVFLPMVLDHEPKSVNQDISIQIPSQNAGTFTSKIVPVVPGSADNKGEPPAPVAAVTPPAVVEAPKVAPAPVVALAPPAAKVSAAAPPKAAVAEPKPKAQVAPPVEVDSEAAPPKVAVEPKAEARPETKPKPKPAKAEGRDSGSFVVQVAALTDVDKAKQMREQIAAAGVKAYTEVVPTVKGNVTRVRAGPFATRDAADKARERLKAMGLAVGNVVPK